MLYMSRAQECLEILTIRSCSHIRRRSTTGIPHLSQLPMNLVSICYFHPSNCNSPHRGKYPPASEYAQHADRLTASLVETFRSMQLEAEELPEDLDYEIPRRTDMMHKKHNLTSKLKNGRRMARKSLLW
ncbi:coatomer subunit beta'-1-like [Salvia divinorum]|uniref:Coatomer subunit beta'-1-like n=1 Tax=Salvia divinorum TaxID=28513 RepID=A0ABD1I8N8_SALDI